MYVTMKMKMRRINYENIINYKYNNIAYPNFQYKVSPKNTQKSRLSKIDRLFLPNL